MKRTISRNIAPIYLLLLLIAAMALKAAFPSLPVLGVSLVIAYAIGRTTE